MTEHLTPAELAETRPRKRAKPDQAEHGLSHWVDAFLDRALIGPGWHTAVETGTWWLGMTGEARMNADNKRRARGIKPYALDWYAWQASTGIYAQWELKVEGRPTRPGQDQTMVALRRNKIPTTVCETVPEVAAFLARAGFELHGNAWNIAAELHERYLANRREHVATVAAPKKKSRPRKVEPRNVASKGMVRRATAKGIFLA